MDYLVLGRALKVFNNVKAEQLLKQLQPGWRAIVGLFNTLCLAEETTAAETLAYACGPDKTLIRYDDYAMLHWAVECNHVQVVELLVNMGLSAEDMENDHYRSILAAEKWGYHSVIRIFANIPGVRYERGAHYAKQWPDINKPNYSFGHPQCGHQLFDMCGFERREAIAVLTEKVSKVDIECRIEDYDHIYLVETIASAK